MAEDTDGGDIQEVLTGLQRAYWQFDADEKGRLLEKGLDGLSWTEALRLHQLCCLEMLQTERGKAELEGSIGEETWNLMDDCPLDFWPDLLARLVSAESPYRPRTCFVWQGEPGASESNDPDLSGLLCNASLTHLGALEVIRLDADRQPAAVAFVGLDELKGIGMGPAAMFRAAMLFRDDRSEDELVWLPLLYGTSWYSGPEVDRDASLTRFIGLMEAPTIQLGFGIGIGHQDFILGDEKSRTAMFGFASVGEVMVPLELTDPKFDAKCRARGLDPDKIRQQAEAEGTP